MGDYIKYIIFLLHNVGIQNGAGLTNPYRDILNVRFFFLDENDLPYPNHVYCAQEMAGRFKPFSEHLHNIKNDSSTCTPFNKKKSSQLRTMCGSDYFEVVEVVQTGLRLQVVLLMTTSVPHRYLVVANFHIPLKKNPSEAFENLSVLHWFARYCYKYKIALIGGGDGNRLRNEMYITPSTGLKFVQNDQHTTIANNGVIDHVVYSDHFKVVSHQVNTTVASANHQSGKIVNHHAQKVIFKIKNKALIQMDKPYKSIQDLFDKARKRFSNKYGGEKHMSDKEIISIIQEIIKLKKVSKTDFHREYVIGCSIGVFRNFLNFKSKNKNCRTSLLNYLSDN